MGRKLGENITIKGHAVFELFGPDGKLKQRVEADNVITTVGKTNVMHATAGKLYRQFNFLAIGSGLTAPAVGQTALVTELARSASGITPTNPSVNVLQLVQVFAAGTGTGTVGEAGLFDASSAGNMASRLLLSSTVVKTSADSLTVTYTLTHN